MHFNSFNHGLFLKKSCVLAVANLYNLYNYWYC